MGGGTKRPGGEETEAQPSKRRKIRKADNEELPRVLFSRLPAHYAARGAALWNRWNKILTGADFWLHRYRRPSPDVFLAYLDRGAKLPYKMFSPNGFEGKHVFNLAAGHSPRIAHGLPVGGTELNYRFFGSCNGLVAYELMGLTSSCLTCVVANPATCQQVACVSLEMSRWSSMFGFGYDPVEDKYKVFVQASSKIFVLPLSGAGGKPMTVISGVAYTDGRDFSHDSYSICIGGVCYVLHHPPSNDWPLSQEAREQGKIKSEIKARLLAFRVRNETVRCIEMPDHDLLLSGLLEVNKKVCVATFSSELPGISLSTLNSALQWERMCLLASVSLSPGGTGDGLLGAWYCRERLVLWFREHGLGLYDLGKMIDVGTACQPTQTVSLDSYKADNQKLLLHLNSRYQFCWGYRPTLIAPGTVVSVDCVARAEDRLVPFMSSGRIVPDEPPMELPEFVASTVLTLLG